MIIKKQMHISDLLVGGEKRTSRTKIDGDNLYLTRTILSGTETGISRVMIGYDSPMRSSLTSILYFYGDKLICDMDTTTLIYTVYENNIYSSIFIDEIKRYSNRVTLRIVGDNDFGGGR